MSLDHAYYQRFAPAPRHPAFAEVAAGDWDDWGWQLRKRLSSLADFEPLLALSAAEREGLRLAEGRSRVSVTPYALGLMGAGDDCPIRRQLLPVAAEHEPGSFDFADPLAEDSHRPVSGIVHRYPDRALLLLLDRCPVYCRYCTRKRLTFSPNTAVSLADLEPALAYLREHAEIRDVLISGGDPFLLATARLEAVLAALRAIPHLEVVRIGTRVPGVLPQRVDTALAEALGRHHPLFVHTHFNHADELTREAAIACGRLADAGVSLANQTVLLRGVNDTVEAQRALGHALLRARVRPYYLLQCDPVEGTEHLRTPIARGPELIDGLRGHTSGYAVPTFVVDLPDGGGKVILGPRYLLDEAAGVHQFRNYRGAIHVYRDPPAPPEEKIS